MSPWQQDRPALYWGASLGIVLALHAAVIGAAVWWQSRTRPIPPPAAAAEAVMVELAPRPRAPPAPPTQLPAGPPQQEQRKTPPQAPTKPTPQPAPQQRLLDKAEVALPPRAPERQVEKSADADVDHTSAPPSVQAPPGGEYAASQSLAGATAQAQADWQSQVLGQLEKFKRYPRAAQRRGFEGTVLVRYAVDRQGHVLSASLAASSGREPLDAEAVAAMQRASPLPPPPPEIPGDPVEVTTPVVFSLR